MKKLYKLLVALSAFILLSAGFVNAEEQGIIRNPSFESSINYWTESRYIASDSVSIIYASDSAAYDGKRALAIESYDFNDARIVQQIAVDKNSYYEISVYAKTQDVVMDDSTGYIKGANLSVTNIFETSESLWGTNDWQKLILNVYTDDNESIDICFALGGYSALSAGNAWFDNAQIMKLSQEPENFVTVPTSSNNNGSLGTNEKVENPVEIKWTILIMVLFTIAAIIGVIMLQSGESICKEKNNKKIFWFVMAIGFVFRIILGCTILGYKYDVSTFQYWSILASGDLFGMYTKGIFLDYPPVYMYVLALLGGVISILRGCGATMAAALVIKLPSIIADMALAYILYKYASKKLNSSWGLFIAMLCIFNPAIWINSAMWGQIDALFTLVMVSSFILLSEKKWVGAGIMCAVSVLLKPHGIIFLPAFGMALLILLIKEKNFKAFFTTIGSGIAAGIVIVAPFYINRIIQHVNEGTINQMNWLWIIDLYRDTVGNYPYATFNAFNFYAFMGKNLYPMSDKLFGLAISQWGAIAIVVAVLLAVVISVAGARKNKERSGHAIVVALLVLATVFTFANKMHERYLFAAIILTLLAFIETKDKGFLYIFIAYSVIIFANTYLPLNLCLLYTYPHPEKGDKLVSFFGGLEVLLWIWTFILSIKTVALGKISKPLSLKQQ